MSKTAKKTHYESLMTKLRDQLAALGACHDAVEWVSSRDITQAWADCQRGDWMLWLASRLLTDRRRVVLAACDCAEQAAGHWTKDTATACIWALDAARRWVRGETDIEEVRAAAASDAAYAASDAAYAAATADASYAAAAARLSSLAASARIVRSDITADDIERAMR